MHGIFRENRNTDVLIFGLDTGRLEKEFLIGDLVVIPKFDLERYLHGYDEGDIGFIVDYAKYGQFRPKSQSASLLFSPMVDDICLIPFRLFKEGWLSAMPISPITNINGIEWRSELNITRHLSGQIWADSSTYKISKKEIGLIQEKYQQLISVPKGYLEMALRRFSRCYKYIQHSHYAGASELDDYWVDLVIALESITSKDKESIKANMARRTALLAGKSEADREKIKAQVQGIYKQRCAIVHGDEKDEITDASHEKRFMEAEALRKLVRDTINACIELLIAHPTTLVNSSRHRKKLPNIIDETFAPKN